MTPSTAEASRFWDGHHAAHVPDGEPRADVRLVEVAGAPAAGRALDLSSGGDARLARRGWQVTVVVIPAHVVPAAPRPGAETGRGSALPRRAAAVVEHGSVAPWSWQQAPRSIRGGPSNVPPPLPGRPPVPADRPPKSSTTCC
ncbi:hypothetical protein [Amycolatopsis sp. Hca4]|uniref:hypothetical protein n=1 Tax=Amycolatopsis sp. Hca4 TaxID=2742131 RepID=UPI0034CECBED